MTVLSYGYCKLIYLFTLFVRVSFSLVVYLALLVHLPLFIAWPYFLLFYCSFLPRAFHLSYALDIQAIHWKCHHHSFHMQKPNNILAIPPCPLLFLPRFRLGPSRPLLKACGRLLLLQLQLMLPLSSCQDVGLKKPQDMGQSSKVTYTRKEIGLKMYMIL